MSDTPRTDAELKVADDAYRPKECMADFARTLERELAAMTRERDGWKSMLLAEQKQRNENLLEIKELNAEVERLRIENEALKTILHDKNSQIRAALGEGE